EEILRKLYELVGERTAADDEKPIKQKKKLAKAEVQAKVVDVPTAVPSEEELNPFLIFPKPEENLKVHTEVFFSDRPVLRFYRLCLLAFAWQKREMDVVTCGKITYTSDYFQELHDLAVELIRRGYAYVDHQNPEEVKEYREKKVNSPWRDRPKEESLKLFNDMRQGLIEEGKATLRMKQDMQSDNCNMYDLIASRIKASLCTLEFKTRRASYYWLLDALDLYQPYVWEYSCLNVTNMVMSKWKLNHLVTDKWVDGWDDPRLMTLAGLRRRGVTSTSINAFVRGIGITRRLCVYRMLT
ncbi:hypothetical protein IFM89_012500, partial [Coptis chinensis]